MTTYAYARISTDGQTLDAQVVALKVAGAEQSRVVSLRCHAPARQNRGQGSVDGLTANGGRPLGARRTARRSSRSSGLDLAKARKGRPSPKGREEGGWDQRGVHPFVAGIMK
jgi:hypothetical protein